MPNRNKRLLAHSLYAIGVLMILTGLITSLGSFLETPQSLIFLAGGLLTNFIARRIDPQHQQ